MKRKDLSTITLFRLVAHSVFINDNKEEEHFPCEIGIDYFEWSTSLDEKLEEFNSVKFTYDMISEFDYDGIELMLLGVVIPKNLYDKIKNCDDFHEIVANYVDYNFIELKVVYKTWQEIMDGEIELEIPED
jgi:folate-dependent tRNA-U54 methylase TrmFO/GidA